MIFNNIIMKVSDIYVSITRYIPQGINIHWWKIKIQNVMIARPLLHDVSIDTYKQEIFQTCMIAYGVYITSSMNKVKVELTAKI